MIEEQNTKRVTMLEAVSWTGATGRVSAAVVEQHRAAS